MSSEDIGKRVGDLDLDEELEEEDTTGVELTDSIFDKLDDADLVANLPPEDERDADMEDFARQFKKIYETKFVDYLKTLKRSEPLNATSLSEKNCDDEDNSTTLVFYFEKIDTDENGNVNAVVAKSFDKTEICHFQPYLCNKYGPYWKTNLYCCLYNTGRTASQAAQNFFLDLPIDLYNLIE